jgi:aerobic-type carbon monoxide dehydrogenase small subunit (CoxS/CutS family)
MASKKRSSGRSSLSRRGFLGGVGAAGGVAALAGGQEARAAAPKTLGKGRTPITLDVNGVARKVTIEPRATLLRTLRNQIGLTGTKEICDRGACGGCSVIIDGVLVNSCMTLAIDAAGKKITTIEGVGTPEKLHPLQEAFVEHDALQCGFCTPGMVMACKALLDGNRNPTLAQIKRGLSGNLCRCGTYPRIFAAVQTAGRRS